MPCYYASSSCLGSLDTCSKCSVTVCYYHCYNHTTCSICGNYAEKGYNRCMYHMNARMFPGVRRI